MTITKSVACCSPLLLKDELCIYYSSKQKVPGFPQALLCCAPSHFRICGVRGAWVGVGCYPETWGQAVMHGQYTPSHWCESVHCTFLWVTSS